MTQREKNLYEAKARVLKALAHPTRLWMAERLAAGPKVAAKVKPVKGLTRLQGEMADDIMNFLAKRAVSRMGAAYRTAAWVASTAPASSPAANRSRARCT